MRNRFCLMTALAWALLAAVCGLARAQPGTAFTYQGSLREGGGPADGAFNIDISLWDAGVGGSQLGSPIMFNDLPVTGGLFTVELDFGFALAPTGAQWLQFSVNGTELSPRQRLTGAPFAIQTRGTFVDENNRVGIGTTTPVATLHVEGPILSGGPNGGDIGARNPSNETASVVLGWANNVPRIRIGGEGAGTQGGFDIQTVGNRSLLRILNTGSVGIGTTAPQTKLHVNGNARFDDHVSVETDALWAFRSVSTGFGDFYAATGVYGQATNPTGNSFGVLGESASDEGQGVRGYASSPTGVTTGVYGFSASPAGRGVLGWASHDSGVSYGVLGRSDSTSGYDVFAGGAGINYGSTSSRRWKHNVVQIPDPLRKLSRLRGVYFDWDAEHGGHRDLGMIAEEVGEVIPEIVAYEPNGIDASGMDYSKLGPLLVEAVKALRAEKDAEIAFQAEEIRMLRSRVARLEALVSVSVQSTSEGDGR